MNRIQTQTANALQSAKETPRGPCDRVPIKPRSVAAPTAWPVLSPSSRAVTDRGPSVSGGCVA